MGLLAQPAPRPEACTQSTDDRVDPCRGFFSAGDQGHALFPGSYVRCVKPSRDCSCHGEAAGTACEEEPWSGWLRRRANAPTCRSVRRCPLKREGITPCPSTSHSCRICSTPSPSRAASYCPHRWSGAAQEDINALAEALVSGRGEASGVAIARQILEFYRAMGPDERRGFFRFLAEHFQPDGEAVATAAKAYLGDPTETDTATPARRPSRARARSSSAASISAPGATAEIVAMRRDILRTPKAEPGLAAVDTDMAHLLASWFNRGFLVVQAASIGRRRPRSSRRSSSTRPCTRSRAGTICAAASIRPTGAASRSSIPRWSTSR